MVSAGAAGGAWRGCGVRKAAGSAALKLEVAPKPNIFRDPGEEILDVLVAENPEHFLSILVCMGKVLGVCRFDVRIRFSVGSSYSN